MDATLTLDVEELLAFARCPLEWWWRRTGAAPSPLRILSRQALSEGLRLWAAGHEPTLPQAVAYVWQSWCAAWGQPALAQDLAAYGRARNAARALMVRARGRGRSLAERLASAGVQALGRRLDDFARARALATEAELDGAVGSALGNRYADSVWMSQQTGRFAEPWPRPERVAGLEVPVALDLPGGVRVRDRLALVHAGAPRTVEVHDTAGWTAPGQAAARHQLRTILALGATPAGDAAAADGTAAPDLAGTGARVVYRHWPSGRSYVFTEGNLGHLQAVAQTAVRALRARALLPRALAAPADCAGCAVATTCGGGAAWPAQHLLDLAALPEKEP